MKRLACEMCGSTDLVKMDGMFVCQNCGVKYSTEEARKMMIDGPVDVSGSSVIIDKTSQTENYYTLARRAREEGNFQNAQKYYELIVQEEPNNWEPVFYATYCAARSCKVAEIPVQCNRVYEAFQSCLKLIKEQGMDESEQEAIISEMLEQIYDLAKVSISSSKEFEDAALLAPPCQLMLRVGDVLENTNRELAHTCWYTGCDLYVGIPLLAGNAHHYEIIKKYIGKISVLFPEKGAELKKRLKVTAVGGAASSFLKSFMKK